MQAATYTRYGGPEVVSLSDRPKPTPKSDELLVRVAYAGVTTADWRLRAAAFPGVIMGLVGRLMFGVFRPRNPVLGGDFSGAVVETGASISGFAPGDRVFGFSGSGAHAEYLCIKATGAVIQTPDTLTDQQASALPFGGLSALSFLEDKAAIQPGHRVLVIGASGGVGVYGVQVARALGATVTGVASARKEALVRALGADDFADYTDGGLTRLTGPYDVIFDTVGALTYREAAPLLADDGQFVPLNFGLKELFARKRNGHRIIIHVNDDTAKGLNRLTELIASDALKPVLDTVYPFERVRDAHVHVEGRHRKGAILLAIGEAAQADAASGATTADRSVASAT